MVREYKQHYFEGGGKEMTNYDRIKDMSVGELADLLARRELSCMPFCEQCDTCNERTFGYPFCVEGIKKWLESGVIA